MILYRNNEIPKSIKKDDLQHLKEGDILVKGIDCYSFVKVVSINPRSLTLVKLSKLIDVDSESESEQMICLLKVLPGEPVGKPYKASIKTLKEFTKFNPQIIYADELSH